MPVVTEDRPTPGRRRGRYPKEFRTDAAALVMERKRIRTTLWSEDNPPLPDLVNQDFAPGEPDVAWCGDITYIPTDEGWLYLASVLDLGSRRLLGWAMEEQMPTAAEVEHAGQVQPALVGRD